MKVTDVKKFNVSRASKIRNMVSITLDDCLVITGIKVIEGAKGLFVSMPSSKNPKGEYKDICFPITSELREEINVAILGAETQEPQITDALKVMGEGFVTVEDQSELPF